MFGRLPASLMSTSSVAAVAAITAVACLAMGPSDRAQAQSPLTKPPTVGIFAFSFPSALRIDIEHETVTLPLHEGRTTDGRQTWYVVTESSDQADATRRGVNYSNKLLNAVGTAAVQKVTSGDDRLVFPGTVDFGLTHVLVPGPNGFPPAQFAAGAAGDAKYSPLVQIVAQENGKTGKTVPGKRHRAQRAAGGQWFRSQWQRR